MILSAKKWSRRSVCTSSVPAWHGLHGVHSERDTRGAVAFSGYNALKKGRGGGHMLRTAQSQRHWAKCTNIRISALPGRSRMSMQMNGQRSISRSRFRHGPCQDDNI